MNIGLVTACNNREVLQSTLLRSPDINLFSRVSVIENPTSATAAYNRGMEEVASDITVFSHQDVYFPQGWVRRVTEIAAELDSFDPEWGVAGVYGLDAAGGSRGWVYSTGLNAMLGQSFEHPVPVRTLDEVVLLVRRSSGLSFDESLPGFHMYGTDVCLEAERRGLRNYAISAFAIHNSNGIRQLPLAFWTACSFIRRKWYDRLPIASPCTVVSRLPIRTGRQMAERFIRFYLRGRTVGSRVPNPEALYQKLRGNGSHVSLQTGSLGSSSND